MLMSAFFYASLYLAVRQSIKNMSVAEVAFLRAVLAVAMMLPRGHLQPQLLHCTARKQGRPAGRCCHARHGGMNAPGAEGPTR